MLFDAGVCERDFAPDYRWKQSLKVTGRVEPLKDALSAPERQM